MMRDQIDYEKRQMIEAAGLAESNGRISGPRGAPAKLGIQQSTLDSKIKALRINKRRFQLRQASQPRAVAWLGDLTQVELASYAIASSSKVCYVPKECHSALGNNSQ
jgi:hypothetical protein